VNHDVWFIIDVRAGPVAAVGDGRLESGLSWMTPPIARSRVPRAIIQSIVAVLITGPYRRREMAVEFRREPAMESPEAPLRIAIVILTINQRETTERVLRSFGAAIDRWSFLVWDNGSADGTADAIGAAFPGVLVHRHPYNLGVGSGRNAAARLAFEKFAPEFLLFLDNDMEVEPGFVDALLEPHLRDAGVGQTQAKLLYMHDPARLNDGGGCRINFLLGRTRPVGCGEVDRGQYDRVAPCISCGGAMMVRARLFEELGGFDPIFDPFGPEDIDFSLRLQKRGYRALYVPDAVARHAVSHTFGEGGYSQPYARAKAKHWLRFLARHGSPLQKIGFALIGAPAIALRLCVREILRGNPGAIFGSLRGLLDAARDGRRRNRREA
jgi:GT2 family glycosyltransferase